jgi:hypothetical protein
MIRLTGLHLLLTYVCNFRCDHCFVWGSPRQEGTMTIAEIEKILTAAKEVVTINSIYFEGGEPFLYYPTLLHGVRQAKAMGFSVGIVSNAYWATSERDAAIWLEPFAGLVDDLSLSADAYHGASTADAQAARAREAAVALGIPTGLIRIGRVGTADASAAIGQLPHAESAVMFRGRAARALAAQAPQHDWRQFDACPYEDLADPGRIHIDPLGNLHLCQGIVLGNLFAQPLATILAGYEPARHPIAGPLHAGGPAELARQHGSDLGGTYAGACHFCYVTRQALRARYPELLGPDQMYGIYD